MIVISMNILLKFYKVPFKYKSNTVRNTVRRDRITYLLSNLIHSADIILGFIVLCVSIASIYGTNSWLYFLYKEYQTPGGAQVLSVTSLRNVLTAAMKV